MNQSTSLGSCEIPPQSGGWVRVQRGELVEIVDVDGQQVADVFAVSDEDRGEWLSTSWTRAITARLFPEPGQFFYSNRGRRMLLFVEDRSPGPHDMLHRSCDPLLYELLGAEGPHPSCADNFRRTAEGVGWTPSDVPDPVNFFQNTPVGPKGVIDVGTALSRAGDSIILRAEQDLVLVATACSVDLEPFINGPACTRIRLAVHAQDAL